MIDATIKANVPATIVEPYAIAVVTPNNFPAPVARSAIPAVTNPIIINGITNFKNAENNELAVTIIFTKTLEQMTRLIYRL